MQMMCCAKSIKPGSAGWVHCSGMEIPPFSNAADCRIRIPTLFFNNDILKTFPWLFQSIYLYLFLPHVQAIIMCNNETLKPVRSKTDSNEAVT